jgi:type VI secretion system protein ImpB
MPDIENGQHWLDRNRPPRVQITYDVEIGDAVEKKELPLVVGVLAHLDRQERDFGEKKFESVDRDNFAAFMHDLAPKINVQGRDITFTSMAQFHPLGLLDHKDLPELRELFEERKKLRDMLAKLDGNAEIDLLLTSAIASHAAGAPGTADALAGALTDADKDSKALKDSIAKQKACAAALQEATGMETTTKARMDAAAEALAAAQAEVDQHKTRLAGLAKAAPDAVKDEYRTGEALYGVLAQAQAAVASAGADHAGAEQAKKDAAAKLADASKELADAQAAVADTSEKLSAAAKPKS